jgi:hypothetical protein
MSDAEFPKLSDKGQAEAAERQKRQAEQLRVNLARRKAQSRARQEGEAEQDKPADPE